MINVSFTRTAANSQTNLEASLLVTGVRYDDTNDNILITVGVNDYNTSSPTYTINQISFSSTSPILSFSTAPAQSINLVRVGDTVNATDSATVVPATAVVETFNATIFPGLDFLVANSPITSLPEVGEVLVNPGLQTNTKVTKIDGNRIYLDKVVPSATAYSGNAVVDYQSLLRVVSINTINNTVTLNRNFGGTGSDIAAITFGKLIYRPALYTLRLQHKQNNVDNLNVNGQLFFEVNPTVTNIVGGDQLPVISPTQTGLSFGSAFVNIDSFLNALRVPRINAV